MNNNRLFYVILPLSIIAIGYLLQSASTVFLWVICAYFLFMIVDPWMKRLTKYGLSPAFAALTLVLVSSAVVFGIGFLFYRASSNLVAQLISYKEVISHFYQQATASLNDTIHAFSHSSDDLAEGASAQAVQAATPAPDSGSIPQGLSGGVLTGISSIFDVLTYLSLTPLLAFFMITEKEQFSLMGTKIIEDEAKAKKMNHQISGVINSYFVGNLLLIVVAFPVFTLAFKLLGVKAYLSLGLISSIFNLVPFLGFIFASTLPTLDLFMNGGHIGGALILIGCCFVTHFTVANVITPKVLGSKVDLNATASTIALISWGHLWGPLGLILAIPITAILKIFFQYSTIGFFERLAALMSENPGALHLQGVKFLTVRLKKKSE